jgi:hypothetical protein
MSSLLKLTKLPEASFSTATRVEAPVAQQPTTLSSRIAAIFRDFLQWCSNAITKKEKPLYEVYEEIVITPPLCTNAENEETPLLEDIEETPLLADRFVTSDENDPTGYVRLKVTYRSLFKELIETGAAVQEREPLNSVVASDEYEENTKKITFEDNSKIKQVNIFYKPAFESDTTELSELGWKPKKGWGPGLKPKKRLKELTKLEPRLESSRKEKIHQSNLEEGRHLSIRERCKGLWDAFKLHFSKKDSQVNTSTSNSSPTKDISDVLQYIEINYSRTY